MISKSDLDTWNTYIKNLWNKPESKFQPTKVRDEEPVVLDLHGMTIQQAFHKTNLFLELHYSIGSKEVLIITGKGGKINDEFPHWCDNFKFISQCEPILDTRGQAGSYYIRLKKS